MATPEEEVPTPQTIAAYVKSNAKRAKQAQTMHHGESVSTRQADYKGHRIVVRTKYEIEIDGKPLMGHMGVNNFGDVHYHPIPNLSFASALDMVKKIIDVYPGDFLTGATSNPMGDMGHDSHVMPGMNVRKKRATTSPAKKASRRKK
jgi:hypothetical protein